MIIDALAGRAAEAGKAVQDAADVVAQKVMDTVDEVQDAAVEAKRQMELSKYRPVMPETLESMKDSKLPQMIVISGSEDRKDIEICKGAVGWLEKQGELDVLFLYEEAVESSGIKFLPWPACESVYLCDTFNKLDYVNLGGYFNRINDEKKAELQNVARMLGASHFKLEEYSLEKTVSVNKGKAKAKVKVPTAKLDAQASAESRESSGAKKKILLDVGFPQASAPQRPELKWYKTDKLIQELIESRFGEQPLTHYHFEVSEEVSASMFKSIAGKVDGALKKMGAGVDFSFSAEVSTQSLRRLVLDLSFE